VNEGTPLRLFNSMGRQVEDFALPTDQRVGLYSCGPTVYADPHLGNMRPYVFSDTLRRVLAWKGYDVTQVVNITDVGHVVGDGDEGEDKVELGARREGRTVQEVTSHYTRVYFDAIAALNVLPAHSYPRASEYVPQMIDFACELEAKGFTYALPSGLYFDTARSASYGALALRPAEGSLEGARVAAVEGKRNAADFAVWRTDPPDSPRIMRWDSPWGPGVPGWHLECSVMSIALLGRHFAIHTGGVDHREIHHPNEIAQSEAFLSDGEPWVPLWMHNEFLVRDGRKIAKSGGKMPTLAEFAESSHPLAFRYFLLTAHYRSQLDLTDAGLSSAVGAYRRLLARVSPLRPLPAVSSFAAARSSLSGEALSSLEALDAAVSDDLHTPRALAVLHGALRSDALSDADKAVLAGAADALLGLSLDALDPAAVSVTESADLPGEEIERLVAARTAARAGKDWAEADRLRGELAALGVTVTDTPEGPVWQPA
jgi:cysteinyl-tRNA synthetase